MRLTGPSFAIHCRSTLNSGVLDEEFDGKEVEEVVEGGSMAGMGHWNAEHVVMVGLV